MSLLSNLRSSVGWRTIVISGSTAAVVSLASALPSDASWAPKPEPKFWSEVRLQMTDQEPATQAGWTFMEAMQSPKIDAAEYLRDPRREDQTVLFQALLLMRKGESNPWGMRQLSMRAQCVDGVLERQDQQGRWTPYSGRRGMASMVNWICVTSSSSVSSTSAQYLLSSRQPLQKPVGQLTANALSSFGGSSCVRRCVCV